MPTRGAMIARQVEAGLVQAAKATGSGKLVAHILRDAPVTDPNVYPPVPSGPPARHPCTALFDEFTPAERAGGGIQANDVKLMVAAHGLAVVPHTGDRIEVKGIEYTIESMDTTRPGGIDLLYIMQLRSSGQIENG